MPKSTHPEDELGGTPGERVTILRKGTPPKTGRSRSPQKGSEPSIAEPAAHTPKKDSPGAKGTQPKKRKRSPPYVIFWPDDGTLWTWATVPPHPRLSQLFGWIIGELKKRTLASVTVLQYFRAPTETRGGPHTQTPCMAIDFTVGGLEGTNATNFAQKVNAHWIHGGKSEGSGKPLRVIRYREDEKGKHFHLEVTELTRPVNES